MFVSRTRSSGPEKCAFDSAISRSFHEFQYADAPFLPRTVVDLFPECGPTGEMAGFFKVNALVHANSHPDIHPWMGAKGGLSILRRSLISKQ